VLSAKANCAARQLARWAAISKSSTRRFGRLKTFGGNFNTADVLSSLGHVQNGSSKLQQRGLYFCVKFNISKHWAVHTTLPCRSVFLETLQETFDDPRRRPEDVNWPAR
jgi:hypothetical protein